MAHYLVDEQSQSDLETNYPETTVAASIQDYLEAQFANGWKLLSVLSRGSDTNWDFIFVPVAK